MTRGIFIFLFCVYLAYNVFNWGSVLAESSQSLDVDFECEVVVQDEDELLLNCSGTLGGFDSATLLDTR